MLECTVRQAATTGGVPAKYSFQPTILYAPMPRFHVNLTVPETNYRYNLDISSLQFCGRRSLCIEDDLQSKEINLQPLPIQAEVWEDYVRTLKRILSAVLLISKDNLCLSVCHLLLPIYYLLVNCLLSVCYLYAICMPSVYYLFANCLPTVCYLYATCMPSVYYLDSIYSLSVCHLFPICLLSFLL